ncbi:MAG: FAD-dependent oxidoreductase [Gammaproteobacteria bacterium]
MTACVISTPPALLRNVMNINARYDVIIIGAGPAGLAAACELRARGVHDILVVERESVAGGVPRHCGHRSFGWLEFYRWLRGPDYAQRLRQSAHNVPILCGATATALHRGGEIDVSTVDGVQRVTGRHVLLAMGIRETPRSARLISGSRPWGVMTTGALQQFVYLSQRSPCKRAVVVGSELVAYSALLTLKRAGAKVVAMIEDQNCSSALRFFQSFLPQLMGTRLITNATVAMIHGRERVSAVDVHTAGGTERIDCDAVIFSGDFVPESALLRASHIAIDPGTEGPIIDQYGRCTDPAYFAAGNLLRAVEPSWNAWREGRAVAGSIIASLRGELAESSSYIVVNTTSPLQYVCPQRLAVGSTIAAAIPLHVRAKRRWRGRLQVVSGGREVWSRKVTFAAFQSLKLPAALTSLRSPQLLTIVASER